MAEGPLRIAVSGYYGCGNTGDEAVLAGIVESFSRRAGPNAVRFTVLSQDPEDTRNRHGLAAVERMNLSAVRAALRDSDLLISGGGSLLQDTTSIRSLLYYLWIARMGFAARIPVMFYAQGIGPLRSPVSRRLTRIVANKCARITVRDPGSAELLKRIGVSRPPIEVTADPAFALTSAPKPRVESILAEAGVVRSRTAVGVSVRPWPTERGGPSAQAIGRMCDIIIERSGAQILFIPMQPPGDESLSVHAMESMKRSDSAHILRRKSDSPLAPAEALGVIAALDGLVAMRLHALIFAAAARDVPICAIGYDPKVSLLMDGLGQAKYCVELSEFTPDRAAELAIQSIGRGDAERTELNAKSALMAERALANVDAALAAAKCRRT